jgi:DNA primase
LPRIDARQRRRDRFGAVTWHQLSAARTPDRFTINTVRPRLARLRSDPWKAYWKLQQRIPRHAVRALEAM